MSRIIGVRDLHIAELTKDDVGSEPAWGTPVRVPSLISIDIADQTEKVTFYSDDVIEQTIPAFTGKEVTIELGYLSHEVEALISGNSYENGIYKQSGDSLAKEYAILFRAPKSKGGFRYITLFKGVLAREEENYKGKEDSIESSNITLSGIFMPLASTGEVEMRADSDTVLTEDEEANQEKFNKMIKDWFTKVQNKLPAE